MADGATTADGETLVHLCSFMNAGDHFESPSRRADPFLIASASVVGASHRDEGHENQDEFSLDASEDGTIIAVVCDGAGSAREGRRGAEFISKYMTNALRAMSRESIVAQGELSARQKVATVIETAREALQAEVGSQLEEFHCTLTGCIAWQRGIVFFQIGDSITLTAAIEEQPQSDAADAARIGLSANYLLAPQNGAFADETFFVTQDGWRDRLVVDYSEEPWDVLTLMTDGAAALSLEGESLRPGFLSVIVERILSGAQEPSTCLLAALSDERIDAVVSDDRTMIVLIQPAAVSYWKSRLQRNLSTDHLKR